MTGLAGWQAGKLGWGISSAAVPDLDISPFRHLGVDLSTLLSMSRWRDCQLGPLLPFLGCDVGGAPPHSIWDHSQFASDFQAR